MEGAVVIPGRVKVGGRKVAEESGSYGASSGSKLKSIKALEDEMYAAAKALDFERAAALRDRISELKHN